MNARQLEMISVYKSWKLKYTMALKPEKLQFFYERRHEQLTVCCFFLQSSLTLGSQGMIFP